MTAATRAAGCGLGRQQRGPRGLALEEEAFSTSPRAAGISRAPGVQDGLGAVIAGGPRPGRALRLAIELFQEELASAPDLGFGDPMFQPCGPCCPGRALETTGLLAG